MSAQTVVLAMASIVLPPRQRARWREEASAVLMEVSGARRWWYTVDTVVKVPVLAWHYRRGRADRLPVAGRRIAAVVGAALLASALMMAADLLALPPLRASGVIGFDLYVETSRALPVLSLLDPSVRLLMLGGLFALVAARSFRMAQRPGGGLQYADSGALLVTALVIAGTVGAWPLSIELDAPAVAVAGSALPGAWLVVTCASALRRRTGPRPLALAGIVAGVTLTAVLVALPLRLLLPGSPALPVLVGHLSLLAVPAYLVWSGWTGVRLLLGRPDLLVARPAGPAGARPGEVR
jgi:hypothetical protein